MRGEPKGLWGKFRRDEKGACSWHPLSHHCIDVAACTETLLRLPIWNQRLAHLLGEKELPALLIERLTVIAFLHDAGKVNSGFQRKWKDESIRAGHTQELISLLLNAESKEPIDALNLEAVLPWFGEGQFQWLLEASVSHHGKPTSREMSPELSHWVARAQNDPIAGLRSLAVTARSLWPRAFEDVTQLQITREFVHGFAGLVSLADWIGSNIEFFPYSDESETDSTRFVTSRVSAARVMRDCFIDMAAPRARFESGVPQFSELFRFEPRAAQIEFSKVVSTAAEPGSVTILEAETGSGKTEAALLQFVSAFARGEVDGVYFALPTRTSATQIHKRIVDSVRRWWPDSQSQPPVVLAVPGYLRVDERDGVRLPEFKVLWNDDPHERVKYRGWAAENTKRYLAGSIVVGTIDQVLLSSLQVPHAHLRATALLRHLLVVDEVHASDHYMSRILEQVLKLTDQRGGMHC